MFESIMEDVDEGSERGSFVNRKKDFVRRMSSLSSGGLDNSADTLALSRQSKPSRKS